MPKPRLLALASLGLAILIFIYLIKTKPESHQVEPQEKVWPAQAVRLQAQSYPLYLGLYARVDVLQDPVLSAALAADVHGIQVVDGQWVQAGQLLIQLDDRDAKLAVAQKKIAVQLAELALQNEKRSQKTDLSMLPHEKKLYQLAETEIKRQRDLKKNKLSSQASIDQSERRLHQQAISLAKIQEKIAQHQRRLKELQLRIEQTRTALAEAQLQLERTQIKAPFDGWVISVQVSLGQRVNPGSPLISLLDPSSLVLRAVVPESRLHWVQPFIGQSIEIQWSGEQQRAELLSLSPRRGQAGLEILIRPEKATDLYQGQVLDVDLILPQPQPSFTIPFEALYGTDKIYRIDAQNRLQPLHIERVGQVEIDGRRQLLIRSDVLKDGDQILASQLPQAIKGLKIKVIHD